MENQIELKVGDLVMLKSGSVHMTVAKIDYDKIQCVWYSEKEDKFKTENLITSWLQLI